MAVTRAWKVYGAEGHRQREAFGKSARCVSSEDGKTRILEWFCYDKTGTWDYVIVRITRDTAEECEDELDAQLEDGLFENSRTGKIVEIPADERITQKAARKLLCKVEISKQRAKQINRMEHVYDALLEDPSPESPVGSPWTGTEAEAGADNSMDDVAEAQVYENHGEKYLHVSMTMLEIFRIDEDGEYFSGSVYKNSCEFSEQAMEIIKEFCGF